MNLKIFKILDFHESKNKDKSKNKESYSKKDLKYLIIIYDSCWNE